MGEVVLIAPAGWHAPTADVRVMAYGSVAEASAALATAGDVVFVSDGLSAADEASIADAVRARTGQTIEVRSERWDGETPSPLSAACRGVISGFGAAGAVRAIEALRGS